MYDPKDVIALKMVRAELARRGIDFSRADVRVLHGLCHIRGILSATDTAEFHDLDEEVHHVVKVLRQRPGIKDVILEISTTKMKSK